MLLAVTDATTKRHSTKVGVFLVAVKNLEIPLKNIFNEIDGLDILFLEIPSLTCIFHGIGEQRQTRRNFG